jgi:DNA invertase Pin-like site-specific DNA recombinase
MSAYFYSRCSTINQNEGRQIESFKACCDYNPKRLYIDKVSGKIPFLQRPAASKLFSELTDSTESNKTLVIDSVDRLGRDLIDIMSTIELFTKNKICIKSIKEGFETLTNGQENPVSKMTLSFMATIAEFEKNRIRTRQAEGIYLAKASGKYRGRKTGTIMSDVQLLERHPVVVDKLKKGWAIREISQVTGKSSTTICKVKQTLQKRGELI